ncbi:alpha/beta hydrolase [soil metagenome]
MNAFHPDLRVGRFIPRFSIGPRLTWLANRPSLPRGERPEDMLIEDVEVPGPAGAGPVPVRVYRPRTVRGQAPVLLWLHGGGMVLGNHAQDERTNLDFARTLGITVVSVGYRLAPEHPAPAALEDAYVAYAWLVEQAVEQGIDVERIAVGGASAGGGLAAGLALMIRDRGGPQPAFQLLVYPMLDDRTVLRDDVDTTNLRVWLPGSNRFGWTAYLGEMPGGPDVSPYAAPARSTDLSGLPPAWIGVGTLDLFHDEDVTYAERLEKAGVLCALDVVPGAFHGFDAFFAKKEVSREFWRSQARALDVALFPDQGRLRR